MIASGPVNSYVWSRCASGSCSTAVATRATSARATAAMAPSPAGPRITPSSPTRSSTKSR
ncbi:hypothetical protein ASF75_14640 [Curtobacterium sp. Leaf154]|nr:hypothetical protein ASF75_14640 [Curtobacterium sp. Leaf154]